MKLDKFAHDLFLWSLIAAIIVLIIISIFVRDYEFIVKNPKGFIWEMIVFSVIPPLIIVFVFFKTRKINVKDSLTWLGLMIAKFAIFHVLFQLAGIYSILFQL